MKKYCLSLIGVDSYSKKKDFNSVVLQDIQAFAERMKVSLKIQNSGVIINHHRMSIQQLNSVLGKRQVFNWIMEKYDG